MSNYSEKLDEFFSDILESEGGRHFDHFWEALRSAPGMEPDCARWAGEDEWAHEEWGNGFEFGRKVGDKPLIWWGLDGNDMYYIGTEEEVLARVKKGWEDWLKDHPLTSKEEHKAKSEKRAELLRKKREIDQNRTSARTGSDGVKKCLNGSKTSSRRAMRI